MGQNQNLDIQNTSLSLLERLKANESESWHQLFELYGPLVYYWCQKFEIQHTDIKDVVQNIFSLVSRKIKSFHKNPDEKSRFRAWLWTITKNEVRQFFRDKEKSGIVIGGKAAKKYFDNLPETEPVEFNEPSKNSLSSLMNRCIRMVKNDFKPTTWSAFELTAIQGLKASEAAEETGLSEVAVRKAKSRVLKKIRDEFIELIDEKQLNQLAVNSY